MHKIWKIDDSKSNKIILIRDKVIYKGNPKENNLSLNYETSDSTLIKDLFSIPYSYIKKIENQSGENHIKIFFGNDSEEELYVNNESTKNEIFEFLKIDNQNLKYSNETPSILNYVKAQLFALLSASGIFIWSLYLAIQIESGVEYELVGGGKPGITGIVLIIANFGSFKITLGYLLLLFLIFFSLNNRLKSRSETQILKRE